MVEEFKLPDVGEGVAEGELVSWLVGVGDAVTEDQPVAEVETDKALVEVPAPVDGTVRELRFEEGDVVPVGDVFITFDTDEKTETETTSDAAGATDAADTVNTGERPAGTGNGTEPEEVSTPGGRTFAAPSTRRLARELGVDLGAVSGSGPGGRVTDADVRAAADTDVGAGAGVGVGVGGSEDEEPEPTEPATADVGEGATDTGSTDTVDPTGEPVEAPPVTESADREKTLATPATRRVAREEGVDIDAVPAVEQREDGAFVTAEAVEEYAVAQRRAQDADTTALVEREGTELEVAKPNPGTEAEAGVRETREPYRGVRKTIGQQMEDSKFTAPHVTHHDEVDVTELVETRAELKPVADERGIRLTYMPFVMKAVTAALAEFPYVNASLDEENEEIVTKQYYNIGVATATDAGLMVPVVDDVDRKSLLQVASETNELVTKARERSIAIEEMRGGTFTITNVGGIGGEYATPIINHPEVAILALGEIKQKPRVVDGEVVPRHVMTLSLSFDHRVVDGAIGARFTNEVKEYLRTPKLLLLE